MMLTVSSAKLKQTAMKIPVNTKFFVKIIVLHILLVALVIIAS